MKLQEVKGRVLAHGQEPIASACILILAVLSAGTLLFARLIPGVDLPNHLAVATIVRYAGDLGNSFTDFFHVEAFLRPCIFHPTFCSFSIWPSVEFANRILLTIYAMALPLTVMMVIRRVGGSMWLGLLSLLLIHNFNMSWGFVGFTMAIPVVLLILRQILDYMTAPTMKRAVVLAALCLFLYTVHVLALLFVFVLLPLATIFVYGINWRRLWTTIAIMAPSAILVAWWWWLQPTYGNSTLHHLHNYYANAFLSYLSLRPMELLTLDNYFLFSGNRGFIAAIVSGGVIVVSVVLAVFYNRAELRQRMRTVNARVLASYFTASLACFALLPHKLPGEPYIYQRFSCHLLLALLLAGAYFAGRKVPFALRYSVLGCATVSVILWSGYVRDFDRQNAEFSKSVFADIDTRQPAAALIFDDEFRGQPLYMQFANYYIVWNHGIMTTSIVDYRFGLVRRRVTSDVLPIYNPIVGRFPSAFDPASIEVPYVVTRGSAPVSIRPAIDAMTIVQRTGEWAVYRRDPIGR